jgi:hypothetical protein
MKYHKLSKYQCNIETIVGHEYDKIIIQIALHYNEVFARAKPLAITDKPQNYDFSTITHSIGAIRQRITRA